MEKTCTVRPHKRTIGRKTPKEIETFKALQEAAERNRPVLELERAILRASIEIMREERRA